MYRGIEVIIFYLRTNRNATADEITRVDEKALPEWGKYRGLARIDIPDSWGAFETFLPHLDWTRPRRRDEPLELTDEIIESHQGRVAKWNPASFTSTGFLERLGIRVHSSEYRFKEVVKQLSRWLEWAPVAKEPYIFLGSAHTGHEVMLFQRHMKAIAAPVAILVTPSEVTGAFVANHMWAQHFWIDSSTTGDVLGG